MPYKSIIKETPDSGFHTNIVNSTTSPNIGKGCSSGNQPSSGQSFSGRTITSTELIESLTCLSPQLTIGFSRKTLCLFYHCSIPLPNVLLVRISNPIAFTIQSPSNQLITGIVHLWTFTFGSPLTLQAYTIGISNQKGIKIGYLNATYVAGQHTTQNKILRREKYVVSNMC